MYPDIPTPIAFSGEPSPKTISLFVSGIPSTKFIFISGDYLVGVVQKPRLMIPWQMIHGLTSSVSVILELVRDRVLSLS